MKKYPTGFLVTLRERYPVRVLFVCALIVTLLLVSLRVCNTFDLASIPEMVFLSLLMLDVFCILATYVQLKFALRR